MNGSGYRNFGDDSQLLNAVLKLQEKGYKDLLVFSRAKYIKDLVKVPTCNSIHSLFKNCKTEAQLIKKYKHLTEGFANTKNLNESEKRFVKNLKSLDVFFFAGSGTINTRHLKGLCLFLAPLMIAKRLEKKVILSAQGIGPMNNEEYFPMIKEALDLVDYISVRDFESGIEELKKIGIEKSIIKVSDDAFDFPISTNRFAYLKNKKAIGINVSSYINEELKHELYNVAKRLKEEGYYPIFNHFQNEIEIAKQCASGEFPIVEFNSASEISEFYSYCKLAIGMRYHSTIFSLSHKVPHINLYRNDYQKRKINAIENEFKMFFGIDCRKQMPNLYEELKTIKAYKGWDCVYSSLQITKYTSIEAINESS